MKQKELLRMIDFTATMLLFLATRFGSRQEAVWKEHSRWTEWKIMSARHLSSIPRRARVFAAVGKNLNIKTDLGANKSK